MRGGRRQAHAQEPVEDGAVPAVQEEDEEGGEGRKSVEGAEGFGEAAEALDGRVGSFEGVRRGLVVVEQVVLPFGPEVLAADGDEAVHALLQLRWRLQHGAGLAGVGVAQVLQRRAVRRVVVPDGQLEQDGAQDQQDLGVPFVFERRGYASANVLQGVPDLRAQEVDELGVEKFSVDLADTEGRPCALARGDGIPKVERR